MSHQLAHVEFGYASHGEHAAKRSPKVCKREVLDAGFGCDPMQPAKVHGRRPWQRILFHKGGDSWVNRNNALRALVVSASHGFVVRNDYM